MLMGAEPVKSILHLSYPCDIPSYQQPFLVWRITLCVSVWPEFPEHSRRHTTMDVGKSSSSSLSKVPFFFLLASEPGNFGRKECHSQTELDRRLAVCQAGLGLIPVCYGREKRKTIRFVLDSTNSAKFHLFPSALCKCDNGSGWRTCRQLNGKAHLPESTISGAWSSAVPWERKPHHSPGNDSLLPQPTPAVYVAISLFILISEGMIEWLYVFGPIRNGRAV